MFEGRRVLMTALIELELPAGTVRLCDGGLVDWPARGLFTSKDPTFGTIGDFSAPADSTGDDAPNCSLALLVPTLPALVQLADPVAQGSPVRMWIAEVDAATGAIVGTPELQFLGFVDSIETSASKGMQEAKIEVVSAAERLFLIAEGNACSNQFHQRAWPAETGFALCTGSEVQVPWGVAGGSGWAFFGRPL